MKRFFSAISFLFVFVSCNETAKKATPENSEKQEIVYDMYEPSEMANLMNQMYAYNLEVKNAIVSGKDIEEFR